MEICLIDFPGPPNPCIIRSKEEGIGVGHLGFSYVGLLYLLMLFIPNGIWTRYKPAGYDQAAQSENKNLRLLEGVGQVGTTAVVLVFKDFNLSEITPWSLWLAVSFACMLAYEYGWIRYFRSSHTLYDFYRPLGFLPVPLATLPVLAFFLLGVYGKVIWLLLAATLLGIGHIGIHWQHHKRLQ